VPGAIVIKRPRLITDLSPDDYHADGALSKHRLDLVRRSLTHYLNPPKFDSPALQFGRWAHSAVLEPDDFAKRSVEVDVKTKAAKAYKEAVASAPAGAYVMTTRDAQALSNLADATWAHPIAFDLLSPGNPGAMVEASMFWDDPLTGIRCKCRPDYVCDEWIVDFKTCQSAELSDFERDAAKYRYHVQAAWYRRGVAQTIGGEGAKDRRFIFVAVEKKPPYACAVFEYDDDALEIALAEALIDMNKVAEYRSDPLNYWTGYPRRVQSLKLPRWAHEEVSKI